MRLSARALAFRGLLCALFLLVPGDRSAAGSDPPRKVLGSWGGDHINLILTEAGGRAEFDCAHGSIDESFLVDAEGKFDLQGAYVPEHPGPIRYGEKPEEYPARYRGSVDGDSMVLTATVPDRNQSLGPFKLFQGKRPRVHKCL
ncbi:MAG: hypothetical protein ACRD1B_04500 [Thermoanaerobaculia bacterium]